MSASSGRRVPSKSGFLDKRSTSRLSLKKYKRRWMVLEGTTMLCYKDASHPSQKKPPAEAIRLSTFSVLRSVPLETDPLERSFELAKPFEKVYFTFAASSKDEKKSWMKELKYAVDYLAAITKAPKKKKKSKKGTIKKSSDSTTTSPSKSKSKLTSPGSKPKKAKLSPSRFHSADSGVRKRGRSRSGSGVGKKKGKVPRRKRGSSMTITPRGTESDSKLAFDSSKKKATAKRSQTPTFGALAAPKPMPVFSAGGAISPLTEDSTVLPPLSLPKSKSTGKKKGTSKKKATTPRGSSKNGAGIGRGKGRKKSLTPRAGALTYDSQSAAATGKRVRGTGKMTPATKPSKTSPKTKVKAKSESSTPKKKTKGGSKGKKGVTKKKCSRHGPSQSVKLPESKVMRTVSKTKRKSGSTRGAVPSPLPMRPGSKRAKHTHSRTSHLPSPTVRVARSHSIGSATDSRGKRMSTAEDSSTQGVKRLRRTRPPLAAPDSDSDDDEEEDDVLGPAFSAPTTGRSARHGRGRGCRRILPMRMKLDVGASKVGCSSKRGRQTRDRNMSLTVETPEGSIQDLGSAAPPATMPSPEEPESEPKLVATKSVGDAFVRPLPVRRQRVGSREFRSRTPDPPSPRRQTRADADADTDEHTIDDEIVVPPPRSRSRRRAKPPPRRGSDSITGRRPSPLRHVRTASGTGLSMIFGASHMRSPVIRSPLIATSSSAVTPFGGVDLDDPFETDSGAESGGGHGFGHVRRKSASALALAATDKDRLYSHTFYTRPLGLGFEPLDVEQCIGARVKNVLHGLPITATSVVTAIQGIPCRMFAHEYILDMITGVEVGALTIQFELPLLLAKALKQKKAIGDASAARRHSGFSPVPSAVASSAARRRRKRSRSPRRGGEPSPRSGEPSPRPSPIGAIKRQPMFAPTVVSLEPGANFEPGAEGYPFDASEKRSPPMAFSGEDDFADDSLSLPPKPALSSFYSQPAAKVSKGLTPVKRASLVIKTRSRSRSPPRRGSFRRKDDSGGDDAPFLLRPSSRPLTAVTPVGMVTVGKESVGDLEKRLLGDDVTLIGEAKDLESQREYKDAQLTYDEVVMHMRDGAAEQSHMFSASQLKDLRGQIQYYEQRSQIMRRRAATSCSRRPGTRRTAPRKKSPRKAVHKKMRSEMPLRKARSGGLKARQKPKKRMETTASDSAVGSKSKRGARGSRVPRKLGPRDTGDTTTTSSSSSKRRSGRKAGARDDDYGDDVEDCKVPGKGDEDEKESGKKKKKSGLDKQDEAFRSRIAGDIIDEKPDISFRDVQGLVNVKLILYEAVILPQLRPDIFRGARAPTNGLLLFGPPGNGKTMIAKCVAAECQSTFFSISASSITSKFVGDAERIMRTLFQMAREKAPSIIFIDEIDSLLTARGGASEAESSRKIKTEFLIQFDGVHKASEASARVLLIGATNLPHQLDDAVLRRFSKKVMVPLPDADTRLAIIHNVMSKEKCYMSAKELSKVVKLSKGYSGSDLSLVCKDASMGPVRKLGAAIIDTKPEDIPPVSFEHFRDSLRNVRPSLALESLQIYTEWDSKFGSQVSGGGFTLPETMRSAPIDELRKGIDSTQPAADEALDELSYSSDGETE